MFVCRFAGCWLLPQAGGDLCAAKRTAHAELRAYAATFAKDRAISPCARFVCFARLADLPQVPAGCPPLGTETGDDDQSDDNSAGENEGKGEDKIEAAETAPYSLWREVAVDVHGRAEPMQFSLGDDASALAARVAAHGAKHGWAMLAGPSGTTLDSNNPEAAAAAATAAASIIQRYHTAAMAAKVLV